MKDREISPLPSVIPERAPVVQFVMVTGVEIEHTSQSGDEHSAFTRGSAVRAKKRVASLFIVVGDFRQFNVSLRIRQTK